ncbi:MAG: hypothetical protein HFH03_10765 [Dorea sp.]|jgi:hypothetical protein|nr:hypothetical protein [Dorea sp.]
MKERTAMKKIRTFIFLLAVIMTLPVMVPNTAEASSKKTVTVSVKGTVKREGKYSLELKKSGQFTVKYGKKNVTKKAKYKVSNKKVVAVDKKGKITAKKIGSCTVTIKYKGKIKKVKFIVAKPAVEKKSTEKKNTYLKIKKPRIIQRTGKRLTGPKALIACGDYYNSVLEKAVKRGEKWVYSNSGEYVLQSGSFDEMLSGKIRGGNCASIANWAFRDMGIISGEEKFYGDSKGYIRHYNSGSKKLKSKLDKNCTIINGRKQSSKKLMKAGKIKAGDIIIGKGHTYVYRGNGTVFASGHDGIWHKDKTVKTEDPKKAVFETWVTKYKGNYNETFEVHYIIRLKSSFVPRYYRDKNGDLVKNR